MAARVLLMLLAVSIAGCGGGGTGPTTPRASSVPRTTPVAATPVGDGTQLYDGQAFALVYPSGWWVHSAEQPTSSGTRTTILDPHDRRRLVQVGVSAHAARSARAQAAPSVHRLRAAPGYHQLALGPTTFQGHAAVRWRYRVGPLRDDVLFFADDAGRGITIRTQAPAADYARWAPYLDGARDSFRPY